MVFSVKSGLTNSIFVNSALVDMYMKVGIQNKVVVSLKKMTIRNVVSWTAVIVGIVHAGYNLKGLLSRSIHYSFPSNSRLQPGR